MDATNPAARRPLPRLTDVVTAESAPRPTAVPPRVHFASVLASTARGLVRGAEQAMTSLPGGPLVALAIRGTGAGSSGAATMSASPMSHGVGVGTHSTSVGGTSSVGSTSPEGPQPTSGGSTGADGSIQYLQVSGEPMFDGASRFTGFRGVGMDITERMRRAA